MDSLRESNTEAGKEDQSNSKRDGSWEQKPGEKVREINGERQKQTSTGEDITEDYYVQGNRPLDLPKSEWLYPSVGEGTLTNPIPGHHEQFIKSDGTNFGLFPDGPREDKDSLVAKYKYADTTKYRADCIDEARAQVDAEIKESARLQKEKGRSAESQHDRFDPPVADPGDQVKWPYDTHSYNCISYKDTILARAEIIAKRKGVSLIKDK